MTTGRQRPGRYARSFPTRTGIGAAAMTELLKPGVVYRMIVGLDHGPRVLTADELATLGDPFAVGLLHRGSFPLTARTLLAAVEALPPAERLPVRRVFFLGDGGQIPHAEAPDIDRQLRFAITYGQANEVELMVSTGTALDSGEIFLQVLAWDPRKPAFNYYLREGTTWIWSGDSTHALVPPSRGMGPFDSHVNGSLVMKELKAPWSNWHSQSAAIEVSIAPGDPLRGEPLFQARTGAQDLEQLVVKPGIARWNQVRIGRDVDPDGAVRNPIWLMRQVLETTSVNLISTDVESASIADGDRLRLPLTFFLDADSLLDRVGLEADVERPSVSGAAYRRALATFEVALTDGQAYRRPGDTHFAFLVPERAYEDVDVLDKLLARGVLSRRVAAALLMTDFANPTHSARRAALMAYVPADFRPGPAAPDLGTAIAQAITAAAPGTPVGSPEREAWANLSDEHWEVTFARRIECYVAALQDRLDGDDGFDDIFRLAESRRRSFRALPLAEFSLTIPVCSIPPQAPRLRMNDDATLDSEPAAAPP